MLVDYADVFMDVEETERVLGVPTLGCVPTIEDEAQRLLLDISSFSPLVESYRAVRANIRFVTEEPPRSLLITSSVPAEGKSTHLANLALVMAMAIDRNRIIVVDGDLRRPRQHKLFGQKAAPGLVDVLKGTHTLEEVLQPTTVPNLRIISAGAPPQNPTELLESDAMGRLLAELETICDTVLIDSPPTLAVADGPSLAARAGGVILLIGSGETKRLHAQQSLKILSRARANIVGTVLNRVGDLSTVYYYQKEYAPTEGTSSDLKPRVTVRQWRSKK